LKGIQLHFLQRIYRKLNYRFLTNVPVALETIKQAILRGSDGMLVR